ncbi:hypothetical protein OTK49_21305 [Vibrio coralliirubri]|uniref:hypothetical protein n=1 Tax=Vibrio coralliirubri TaxID=1516159 RepID=UPI002283642B|nr:hypothetical protein [Vibrio coralliirubri]MCY9865059.1 hypothetical protein [Vibrio coralliirubri]
MMNHLTWKMYNLLIQEARDHARIEATAEFSTVRSRGWWLSASGNTDTSITENADLNATALTLQLFLEEHMELVERGAISISISGGFDGADSLYDLNNGNYTPWVTDWSFEIWNSTDGWIQAPMRETVKGKTPFMCMESN